MNRFRLGAAALGAAAVIGVVAYLVLPSGHSSTPQATTTNASVAVLLPGGKAPKPLSAEIQAALNDHVLLKPECAPVKSLAWVYPGSQSITSNLYELFAINYSCDRAAAWMKKMVHLTIPVLHSGNETKLPGPKGFYCSAWPDEAGHAYSGGCQHGNIAFGWNWNVANRRVVFTPDENGVVHLEKLIGSDVEPVLTMLGHGHWRLDVHNTSGVGFLNNFQWSPPTTWTITALDSVTGGKCLLTSPRSIQCSGMVKPPSCLC
jgi:hypothetical protein